MARQLERATDHRESSACVTGRCAIGGGERAGGMAMTRNKSLVLHRDECSMHRDVVDGAVIVSGCGCGCGRWCVMMHLGGLCVVEWHEI